MKFKFDEVEDGLEFYKTEDGQHSAIKREDGIFLLYQLKDEQYEFMGMKLYSLEECERTIS